MKLSCIPICFFGELYNGDMTLSEWIHMAAEIGLDGIELYRPFVNPAEPDAWRRVADEIHAVGLEISMLTSYGNLAHPSPDERRRQVESLQADVDQAVLVGTDIVRVAGVAKNLARPREERDRRFLLEQLRISRKLHEVRQIYLVNHEDCGAYGLEKVEDSEEELATHNNDLRAARAMLEEQFPGVEILIYFMPLDGGAIRVD